MIGFLKRLFATPQMVEDTARSAIRGLDDLVYTEQEQAEKTQAGQELYSKMWMAALPSALSRRLIAVAFVFTYCFLALVGVGFYAFEQIGTAEFTFKVLAEVFVMPVNIIVGFYFLKQVVTEYNGKNNR